MFNFVHIKVKFKTDMKCVLQVMLSAQHDQVDIFIATKSSIDLPFDLLTSKVYYYDLNHPQLIKFLPM